MPVPLPPNEAERLARLRALLVLDSPPEPVFDRIVRMAAQACGTPIALISLVDAERQWFKANTGLSGVQQTPRDIAFCAHAISGDAALFEVPDASCDARFADNPLVRDDPAIRFYAGVPLAPDGDARVGTLCVIDRQPRRLDAAQAALLHELAGLAAETLAMRRDLIVRALAARSAHEDALAEGEAYYRGLVHEQRELVSLARPDGTLVYVNAAYEQAFGAAAGALAGRCLLDLVAPADRAAVRDRLERVAAGDEAPVGINRNRGADGAERWIAWSHALRHDRDGAPLVQSVGRDITEQRRAELALRASEAFLERIGDVAGVGGWALELASNEIRWSSQTRRIHEVDPGYVPTLDSAIAFYAPEARPVITTAVRGAMVSGNGWDLELPLVTASGRRIWVRTVGEVEFEHGRAVRLVGAFQDVSARRRLEHRLAQSERFLRQITDAMPLCIAYIDRDRRYRYVNRLHCERLARPREQIIDRTRCELLGDAADPAIERHAALALAGEPQVFEFDQQVGGVRCTFESRLVPDVDDAGTVQGFVSTSIDITERAATQRLLQQQGATLRSVTEAVPAVLAVVGGDLRYRFVNSAFERWRGEPRQRIVGRTVAEVLGEADFARIRPWAQRALAGETVSFECDYPGRGDATHLALTYVPLRLDDGRVDGYVGVAQDITEHRVEQVRLQQLAQRDPLTGLLNRAGFAQRLAAAQGAAGSALLYIDLDRFKPVNDRHGHPVGDRLLQQFADRLTRLVRPTDAVARLGGDEFAILLFGVRVPRHAQAVAAKVVAAAGTPFTVGGLQLCIGASVGVALAGDGGADEQMAHADAALYAAKRDGRGTARLWSAGDPFTAAVPAIGR